jgi:ubiquinone/menaquinone biosynthesis C-methylase UbiE
MAHSHNGPPHGAGRSSFDLIDADRLFDAIAIPADAHLVDLGCGRGAYALDAARLMSDAGRITGIDLWPDGISALVASAPDAGPGRIAGIIADLSRPLPLKSGRTDIVLMATVLHDLVVDGAENDALPEVRRILKPGGTFAVVEFLPIDGPPGPPKRIRLSPAQVAELLAPHGFSRSAEVTIGPCNYLMTFQRSLETP